MDRLVAVLPHLGAVGSLSGDPRRSEEGRRRAQGVRRRTRAARPISSRASCYAARRPTASSPRGRPDDDIACLDADGGDTSSRGSRCRASTRTRTICQSLADFIARRRYPDHLGALHRHRRHRHRRARRLVRDGDHDDYSAIMVKALADRLAEAFAEYLHRQAASTGATARPRRCRTTRSSPRTTAASARRSATRRAPTTRRRPTLFAAARQRRAPRRHAHRVVRDVSDRLGVRAVLRAPERAATSRSGGSATTSSRTTRGGSACPSRTSSG